MTLVETSINMVTKDNTTINTPADSMHDDIVNNSLYTRFKEAFNLTLRNHPGILPGAPTVINSIQKTLFKVQMKRALKEKELRTQLDAIKAEKDKLEQQLRKEIGLNALTVTELAEQLEDTKSGKDKQQESLNKEIIAVQAVKDDLKKMMTQVTHEKEELTKHLTYISQSRAELEKTLETELQLINKDRDALKKTILEREKLQKRRMENKDLENKIIQMSHAVNEDRDALQSEEAQLLNCKEQIKQLKQENESTQQSLEQEQAQLRSIADELQAKKLALIESKCEIEKQYQKELDGLDSQIECRKKKHENDMETAVKRKIVTWRNGGSDTGGLGTLNRTSAQVVNSPTKKDIESLINSRVNEKLKELLSSASEESVSESVSLKSKSSEESNDSEEGRIESEIDRLREEIHQVKVHELKKNLQPTRCMGYPTQQRAKRVNDCRYMSPGEDYSRQNYEHQHTDSQYTSPIDDYRRISPPRMLPPHTSRQQHRGGRTHYRYDDEERDDIDVTLNRRSIASNSFGRFSDGGGCGRDAMERIHHHATPPRRDASLKQYTSRHRY